MKPDPLVNFERIASRSGGEPAPATDVADRVLASLQSRRLTAIAERGDAMLGIGFLLAACAASLLLWLAIADDALLSLAQPFYMVMP